MLNFRKEYRKTYTYAWRQFNKVMRHLQRTCKRKIIKWVKGTEKHVNTEAIQSFYPNTRSFRSSGRGDRKRR